MCGRFLRRLLAEESRRSTPVGRLLLPVLLGFRLVLLAASGPGVYGDEQSEFVCHTQQPGCKAACFDAFHPLSPLRFWVFQRAPEDTRKQPIASQWWKPKSNFKKQFQEEA
ncbi:gap junction gamma-3 protein isoform X1 [Homo sapiens]|uniref:gap junction gamma-3 protein isoform X1 n=1 Tax=Homo sapiens TaxID=9606 RepID=UPI001FB0DA89|nr:gap junction gamma-3 protein isoform X1 [Homo sapiens]XP_054214108.1 gap junction gamma-3 protein isoform X1 [Homo sapiens]